MFVSAAAQFCVPGKRAIEVQVQTRE
jgi:hypothetical protein